MNAFLLPAIAAILTGAVVLLLAFAFIEQRQRASMRRTLEVVLGDPNAAPGHGTRSWSTRASAMDDFVEFVGGRVVGARGRERLRKHLAWAGRSSADALNSIIGRKIIYLAWDYAWASSPACSTAGGGGSRSRSPLSSGFYVPDLLLYNQAEHRTEEIRLRLPDALDLLDLCVESGLGLQSALAQGRPDAGRTGRRRVRPRPAGDAARCVTRLLPSNRWPTAPNQIDLQRFVAAMLQVDKLGIPVASVLREQARE